MKKTRLNIYLHPDLRATIQELAGEDGYVSHEIENLLRLGLSLKRGEMIEQQSLPIIRDIVRSELQKSLVQLRTDIREDMHQDILTEIKAVEKRGDNRLAALIVRAIREGGLSRRMIYALLARSDATFAMEVYEDAKNKVGKELASRVSDGAA